MCPLGQSNSQGQCRSQRRRGLHMHGVSGGVAHGGRCCMTPCGHLSFLLAFTRTTRTQHIVWFQGSSAQPQLLLSTGSSSPLPLRPDPVPPASCPGQISAHLPLKVMVVYRELLQGLFHESVMRSFQTIVTLCHPRC